MMSKGSLIAAWRHWSGRWWRRGRSLIKLHTIPTLLARKRVASKFGTHETPTWRSGLVRETFPLLPYWLREHCATVLNRVRPSFTLVPFLRQGLISRGGPPRPSIKEDHPHRGNNHPSRECRRPNNTEHHLHSSGRLPLSSNGLHHLHSLVNPLRSRGHRRPTQHQKCQIQSQTPPNRGNPRLPLPRGCSVWKFQPLPVSKM
jgi:hypothetical protein